ncbi:MAG: 23S rRNA (uracil(1939)-C(5))-methyltransferase RlmD [Chitinophagaceae bacterium]|nr:MAG: 23S rRNA (uracil(1939)-C(5))-methyltransferase RlmD [Chitinophagaceae bacterium]
MKRAPKIIENLEIVSLANNGKGVGKHDGKAYFITAVAPGDLVDARLTKNKKAFAEGVIYKMIKPAANRVTPFCEHFGVCGGCKWQHLDYKDQVFWKKQIVEDAFQRIGNLEYPEPEPVLESEKHAFYRNKLEFSFSDSRWFTDEEIKSGEDLEDNGALGFHIPGRFDKVLNINKCHLQQEPTNQIRNKIYHFAKLHNIPFFNIRKQEGLLRTLIIRISSLGEVMVILTFYHRDEEKIHLIMEYLKNEIPEITSLNFVVNPKGNDTITGLKAELYSGRAYIIEKLGNVKYKIGTHSFFQTNSLQAEKMYALIKDWIELKGNENILDLYTGLGSIALYVSDKAKSVVGIENVEEAIEDAKENARFNNIENCTFYAADVKDFFKDSDFKDFLKPDVIITDPPRAGMHPDVVDTLNQIKAEKIVYVSCNPATQARDLALLSDNYEIIKWMPMDLFPQTPHVENLVLLKLKS